MEAGLRQDATALRPMANPVGVFAVKVSWPSAARMGTSTGSRPMQARTAVSGARADASRPALRVAGRAAVGSAGRRYGAWLTAKSAGRR
jgi:hypothetical protein